MVLPYEDIAEVIPSSYDSRFPVKSIFKTTGMSSSSTALGTASPMHSAHSSSSLLPHLTLSHRPAHSSSRSYWMSTGLVPQFVVISFYEKWRMTKVEVKCMEVEQLLVHVNFSAATLFSSQRCIEMSREGDG